MATAATSTQPPQRDTERTAAHRQPRRLPAAVRTSVLARIAADGRVSHADLARDLQPYLSQRLAAGEIRELLADIVTELTSADLCADDRGRITLLDRGLAEVRAVLAPAPLPKDWIGLRDCRLVALALSVSTMPDVVAKPSLMKPAAAKPSPIKTSPIKASHLKALGTPDGLRAAVLQATYGLPFAPTVGASALRSELAVVALGRAFGAGLRDQLRPRDGLPARTARLIAGQLSRRPRDLGTDQKLIAALAAEAAGAFQTDVDALRSAVLRRWLSASIDAVEPLATGPSVLVAGVPLAQPQMHEPHRPAAANRPGFDGFIAAVMDVARQKAEGWSGNRKAAIARIFDALTLVHPAWALTEQEFKGLLVEAHRLGRLVLSTADLKSKDDLAELQRSATTYRNAVVHFVRVDE